MDWRGPTGFVLATCVGLGFLSAMVAVSFFQDEAISAEGAGLLNTLGGAIVGGVVVWLGGFGLQNNNTREPERRRERGRTMSETTEPRDPATDPERDLEELPQDTGSNAVHVHDGTQDDDDDDEREARR